MLATISWGRLRAGLNREDSFDVTGGLHGVDQTPYHLSYKAPYRFEAIDTTYAEHTPYTPRDCR